MAIIWNKEGIHREFPPVDLIPQIYIDGKPIKI
jgi:hypothetical protein